MATPEPGAKPSRRSFCSGNGVLRLWPATGGTRGTGRDELDLICRDGDVLVFGEVKTRSAGALVPGYYAVDRRKKRVLLRACSAYLQQLRSPPCTYRLDVVEVVLPRAGAAGAPVVSHFAKIPLFPKHHCPGH